MADRSTAGQSPHREVVRPEWVDYNGHMNVAYYVLVFDHGTDNVLDRLGLGRGYCETAGRSLFVVESHVTYEAEAVAGDRLRVASRILGCDDKRLHLFHAMHRDKDGRLAATNELMLVHVDLGRRRAAPFPDDARRRIEAAVAAQSAEPWPPQAGRAIGFSAKRSRGR
jgi:acyl-CoA thioester hydrolase